MPARLFACPSCARHVRVHEERCPFCGVTCPDAFASSQVPVAPPRGLTRARMFRNALATAGVAGGGVALAAALSCSSNSSEPPYGAPPGYLDSGEDGLTSADLDGTPPNDAGDAAPDAGKDAAPDASPPGDASDDGG
jgi:hypothetical protein